MLQRVAIAGSILIALATTVSAQTLEKKHYNYSEWTKGRFSEAVTVTGPGKLIFLAGVGFSNARHWGASATKGSSEGLEEALPSDELAGQNSSSLQQT